METKISSIHFWYTFPILSYFSSFNKSEKCALGHIIVMYMNIVHLWSYTEIKKNSAKKKKQQYRKSTRLWRDKTYWPTNLCTSPLMIHKITPSEDYNQWLKHLDTQHNEPTKQNSITVPKLLGQRTRIIKLWGLVK